MNRVIFCVLLFSILFCGCCNGPLTKPSCKTAKSIVWDIDNLEQVAGHKAEVSGAPKIVETLLAMLSDMR